MASIFVADHDVNVKKAGPWTYQVVNTSLVINKTGKADGSAGHDWDLIDAAEEGPRRVIAEGLGSFQCAKAEAAKLIRDGLKAMNPTEPEQ